VTLLNTTDKDAQDRTEPASRDGTEAASRKKETQLAEGRKAMAEYKAKSLDLRERTARLRAERLARTPAGTTDLGRTGPKTG
jgi:hypothetical protein